ncbi:ABC transporter permease [Christensenella tenuis]|jgi:ribose transport system permease protein|nr:ABC transporter permease [Christensenella tenuis]
MKTGEMGVKKTSFSKFMAENNIYVFFVILFIVCAVSSANFLSDINLTNILRQYSPYVVMALGMLLVIMTGGIDLSVGSIIALANVVCAMLLTDMGLPAFLSVLVALLVGTACGLVSGLLIAYKNIAPFIATLAMMTITRALAFVLTDAVNIRIYDEASVEFGSGYFMSMDGFVGLPYQLLVMIPIVAVIFLILKYTSYGRLVIAVGSNREAVRLSGINDKAITLSVYCISALCASIAAIMIVFRGRLASGSLGDGLELDAIAACVIGGASLSGGKGSAIKTVVGVFVLALIGNIMTLLNVPSYPQDIIKGIIILLAVLFQKSK